MNLAETATSQRERLPLAAIHDALQVEWSELSAEIESQTGQPPLRASTSTLVVIAEAGRAAMEARETLHQLASSIPSRVILFILDRTCERATASVWAHCTLSSRGRQGGCYDVIEITISPNRLPAVPNIVSVHRLSQLPTILIWNGPLQFESPVTAAVTAVADRLVIDTESFDDPLRALRNYHHFLDTHQGRLLGSDPAWTRTSTWRELIAQSFDPPATRSFVTNIRQVEIAYDQSQSAGAILLGSWLVSRLGGSPGEAQPVGRAFEMRSHWSSSGRGPTLRLQPSFQAGEGIRSVRILARAGSESARISILRDRNEMSTVRVKSPGMPHQERVVSHREAPRPELIAAELMQYSRNRAYEEALHCAAGFCELVESHSA